jgi:hypothetical protein
LSKGTKQVRMGRVITVLERMNFMRDVLLEELKEVEHEIENGSEIRRDSYFNDLRVTKAKLWSLNWSMDLLSEEFEGDF